MKEKVRFRNTAYFIPLFILIILTACVKDEIDMNNISKKMYWNPKLGIPVAYGELNLEDLIESQDSAKNIRTDAENFMSLVYTSKILSGEAADILQIPDQNYHEVLLESDYALPPFPIIDTIKLNRTNKYAFSFDHGEIIDSVKLKSGAMEFNISSSYKFLGSIRITIPQLTKNKQPLIIDIDINKSDGTYAHTTAYDLSGYTFALTHPNGTDNLLQYDFKAKLINTGNGVSVGDNITVDINFNDIKFLSLFGYIGQLQLLNFQAGIKMPFFQNATDFNLEFFDPRIKLIVANSFGVPARVELFNVRAISEKNNKTVNVGFTPAANPFNISYPNTIGLTAKDSVTFNSTTSNFQDAMAIAPNIFNYGIKASANPGGKVNNYITDSSKIHMDMEIEIPLHLRTGLLEISDTMDMDLGDALEDTTHIKSLLIHSSFENGMPFDLNLQVYFLDQNYQVIDTLFKQSDQPLIGSGTLDAQGKVVTPVKKQTDVSFIKSRISKLKNVRHALVKAGIITSNQGKDFVKFFSTYSLNVNFGVQTELEFIEN